MVSPSLVAMEPCLGTTKEIAPTGDWATTSFTTLSEFSTYYVCFFSSKMGIIMPTSQNCCEIELAQAWLRVSMLAVLATTMITFGLPWGLLCPLWLVQL